MALHVDRERCIGAGMCVLTSPEVFDQDVEDGRVLLVAEAAPRRHEETVRQAVRLCPSGALSIAPGAESHI